MGDLSIQNLVVEYYSGGYALRPINGLNLDVAAGSLVMLLGPSGCGKTTLLSCLGGILRPKSGAIKFDEVDITTLQGAELANYRRNKVGIVFQAFNLVPSLTAVENVMVPLRSAGMSRRASRRRAEELLARGTPGFHPGGGGAAVDPRTGRWRACGRGRNPRQQDVADGRSRR